MLFVGVTQMYREVYLCDVMITDIFCCRYSTIIYKKNCKQFI